MVYALGLIGLGEELAAALVHALLRHGVWLEWKQVEKWVWSGDGRDHWKL